MNRKINMPLKTAEKRKQYCKNWNKNHPNYAKERRKKNPEAFRKASLKQCKINMPILYNLKINGCAICEYNKCNRALHFHHVNPKDKKFNICRGAIPKKDLIDEVNKCILLCSNCHNEIHCHCDCKEKL